MPKRIAPVRGKVVGTFPIHRKGQRPHFRKPRQLEVIGLCGEGFRSKPCNSRWSRAKCGKMCFRCIPNQGRVADRQRSGPRLLICVVQPLRVAI